MGPGGGVTRAQEGMTAKKAWLPPLPSRARTGTTGQQLTHSTRAGFACPALRSLCTLPAETSWHRCEWAHGMNVEFSGIIDCEAFPGHCNIQPAAPAIYLLGFTAVNNNHKYLWSTLPLPARHRELFYSHGSSAQFRCDVGTKVIPIVQWGEPKLGWVV